VITLLVFAFFSALALVSAVMVVAQKNAMRSVLYLAFTVLATAGVFLSLQAEYLAAIQILVYGGGIVVLYIFVIIIVNLKEVKPERRRTLPKLFIVVLPALLLVQILNVLFTNRATPPAGAEAGLAFRTLAEMLFTNYLAAFELASILLLAVLIGAVIVARRRLVNDPD
jgi:NADH-quinone oxidoreductase subunit J